MLFIKNIKQQKSNFKLSHKFINSFHIAKIVEKQTYRLILSLSYCIYDVFHVFYLKFYEKRSEDNFISDIVRTMPD
jgi:hypothetical protein